MTTPSKADLYDIVEEKYQYLRKGGLDAIRAEFTAACNLLMEQGESQRDIAVHLGISQPAVSQMLKGNS